MGGLATAREGTEIFITGGFPAVVFFGAMLEPTMLGQEQRVPF